MYELFIRHNNVHTLPYNYINVCISSDMCIGSWLKISHLFQAPALFMMSHRLVVQVGALMNLYFTGLDKRPLQ